MPVEVEVARTQVCFALVPLSDGCDLDLDLDLDRWSWINLRLVKEPAYHGQSQARCGHLMVAGRESLGEATASQDERRN